MVMYEVHRHPVLQKYKTHICSRATLFQFFVVWLTFLPPLIIAYVTYGFWMKESSFREQPDVYYKHQLLLVAQGNTPGSFLAYSTFQNFNQLLKDNLRIPMIKSWEEDTNLDGKHDALHFEIHLPLKNSESIYSIQLILIFDYRLHQYVNLQMESLACISMSSPIAGAEFSTVGDLTLKQRSLLPHKGIYSTYNVPIIDGTSTLVDSYNLHQIFKSYIKRNVSTEYVSPYSIWTGGRAAGQPFVVKGTVNYPEETIMYRPGFWQMIKWAWVQYLAILFIFLFVFSQVKRFVFEEQIVSTVPMKIEKEHRD
ncbi:transmembrane protein 231 [Nematostella vectensis]|uniref:transmembrane protein 231 n=1 Tax=Nematostella vectensis TaxID=45351 RepID=UPI0020770530|nr:transmembrane protein 231 [Nematostella vectensis]